jgi:hypothetical protein
VVQVQILALRVLAFRKDFALETCHFLRLENDKSMWRHLIIKQLCDDKNESSQKKNSTGVKVAKGAKGPNSIFSARAEKTYLLRA